MVNNLDRKGSNNGRHVNPQSPSDSESSDNSPQGRRLSRILKDTDPSDTENSHSSSMSLPKTVIIPPLSVSVTTTKSLSSPSPTYAPNQSPLSASNMSVSVNQSTDSGKEYGVSGGGLSQRSQSSITREQFEYGSKLKQGEVQVLYRSPDSDSTQIDRFLKDEQAKQVAPNLRQSPIAFMSLNPTYELQNKPLSIEYPATLENLRLNNTGFSWEVKIPYQISMTTALYGAHLNTTHHYRLDQFHCHWGQTNDFGSEHTVDNRSYSAEMHFVHYNMEKYHTLSKAARHSDGLVVLSVFIEALDNHHNHAELEKIASHLKAVPLKGDHAIIKQAVRLENLLPANKSYWSYQGSLTTPPYFESVTWFVLKHPIKCNTAQIDKFRSLKSSLRHDEHIFIRKNHRATQPLNGRTIVNFDEPQPMTKHK